MALEFESKFLGHKISKVKFIDNTLGSELFLSGTYDSDRNNLSVWSLENCSAEDEGEDKSFTRISSQDHPGDVTSLDCNDLVIATGNSYGDVNLVKFNKLNNRLEMIHCWDNLHRLQSGVQCPCTGVSYDVNIATCGEDGAICILDVTRPAPILRLESYENTTLTDILWVTQQCVAVSNTCGQLKVFDTRQSGCQPTQLFSLSDDLNILNCLEKHPSQHHLIATGTYTGLMGIFDLRQDNVPITVLEAHNQSSISDIKFHPRVTDNLFTCGSDGSVWQWHGCSRQDRESGWWFFTDATKHKVEISELTTVYSQAVSMSGFETNSLDVCNNLLVCGTDNSSLCVFHNIDIP